MQFFRQRSRQRVPHVEASFNSHSYTVEYSHQTGKYSTADFRRIIDFVLCRIRTAKDARVLDIGSGPGWIGIRLAQRHPGVRVTGIDLSDAFIKIANQNKIKAGVGDRVEFRRDDAEKMSNFRDDSFDVIVSNQSLHYWDQPLEVFNQMSRVLKPKGIFCLGDDRRDLTWLGKAGMQLSLCFHSRRIGESWKQSVAGCFTPDEIKVMLRQSHLRGHWNIQVGSRTMVITGSCNG